MMTPLVKRISLVAAALVGASGIAAAEIADKELRCMALNLYHEARGEPLNGMVAVGQVVMHRVADPDYPETVCGVVTEDRSSGRGKCQFSWWCDGQSDVPTEAQAWTVSQAVARAVLEDDTLPDLVEGGRHYVRCEIDTPWLRRMSFHLRIGSHCFYQDDDGDRRERGLVANQEAVDALFALVADADALSSDVPDDLRLVVVSGVEVNRAAEAYQPVNHDAALLAADDHRKTEAVSASQAAAPASWLSAFFVGGPSGGAIFDNRSLALSWGTNG